MRYRNKSQGPPKQKINLFITKGNQEVSKLPEVQEERNWGSVSLAALAFKVKGVED